MVSWDHFLSQCPIHRISSSHMTRMEATANRGRPDINGPFSISAVPQGAERWFSWSIIKTQHPAEISTKQVLAKQQQPSQSSWKTELWLVLRGRTLIFLFQKSKTAVSREESKDFAWFPQVTFYLVLILFLGTVTLRVWRRLAPKHPTDSRCRWHPCWNLN